MKSFASILFLAFGLFVVACKSDSSSEARDEAREALESNAASTSPAGEATPVTTPSTPAIPAGPTTSIQWMEDEFDFGTVSEGEVVTHVFKFKNTGSEPLIVTDARSTCGCTVPKKPTDPVAPGETGEISVEFNSRGKSGTQSKPITVTANTNPAQTKVTLKGEVVKKEG
ncbi:MAG: DUF1573 domain-containing protein [Saprospiraceae bacterium]|nr:DUF1573 domain-containing protein [Saprospiraceae bacterium]